MSKHLALVFVTALPLVAMACNGGPDGLTAQGILTVSGSTSGGPFNGTFDFPRETVLDGSSGLTAMCTVSRGTGTSRGAVIDLIVPSSASSPLESVTLMVRSDAAAGTIEADVRGGHFANSACALTASYVDASGQVQVQSTGACTLTGDAGTTIDANVDLIIRGCVVTD